MSFQSLVQSAQTHFPNLKIKYKDESLFMKILSKIMFFNKNFMTSYTTTIGSTVYFPSQSFVKIRPISSSVVLLHELVHIHDEQKFTQPVFSFLYACPQILTLLALPALFLFGWKLALIFLLLGAPIPSYFRMYFERRAYFTSLYVLNTLGNKMSFNSNLDKQSEDFVQQFKTADYYYMWPFKNIDKSFSDVLIKIRNGEKPFEDPVFIILDDLIDTASK